MGNTTPPSFTPFHIGMLVFDGMTSLDFAGPADVFARLPNAQLHVLAKENRPVVTDIGLKETPTMQLDDAPRLDLLFVGGGPGVNALMEDPAVLEFLARRAPDAQWVTSVCTGALVLGAAGLLRGYRAATHWTVMHLLPQFGAQPEDSRVVVDRNRITGGGVTAGIDFGLTVAQLLHGERLAQVMQLSMEYDPQPPFDCGSQRVASAALMAEVRGLMAAGIQKRTEIAARVAQRLAG